MRFKIDFQLTGESPFLLPANYHSELFSWIHKMLHFRNNDFIQWLKSKKYLDQDGEYSLFTFSDFFFENFGHQDDHIVIEDQQTSIILSFYAGEDIETFVQKIFEAQQFKIGDAKGKVPFQVQQVQKISMPDFQKSETAIFSCISPMLIKGTDQNEKGYMAPDKKDFDKSFFKSLMFKYANLVKFSNNNPGSGLANLQDLRFKLLSKPKTKIIKIKTDTPHQKSVKGYMFDFEVKAPAELLNIGYNAGFGELNRLGFGCCEVKK